MNQTQFLPVIETDRLTLRELRSEDAASSNIDDALSVLGHSTRGAAAIAIQTVQERVHKGDEWVWALENKDDYTIMGVCGMYHIYPKPVKNKPPVDQVRVRSAEIFYGIADEYAGHRFTTEAVAGMLTFGFLKLGMMEFKAAIQPYNRPSVQVIKKVGGLFLHREQRNTSGMNVSSVDIYRIEFGSFRDRQREQFDKVQW